MTSTLDYDAQNRILLVSHVGDIDRAAIDQFFTDTLEMARRHDTWRILSDCTRMSLPPNILDDLRVIERITAVEGSGQLRHAILRPTTHDAAVATTDWETVAVNRAMKVRIFDSHAEALAWLVGDDRASGQANISP